MADEPIRRETRTWEGERSWVEISHYFGNHESWGDTTLDFTAADDAFEISLSTCRGRDRDNYGTLDESEIKLTEEEARECYLLLHMWLEQRSG
jgi:hypothetical protein